MSVFLYLNRKQRLQLAGHSAGYKSLAANSPKQPTSFDPIFGLDCSICKCSFNAKITE